ncbi:unnamed protein product [Candidula unifasciata]|uniref:Uncharacterized protein n=1 Tax=Candidula unifasciata TaxID=100452 RepID=A0A8S3ZLB7_9EUPU|nr:unnamed protein product [Candidula unifasciata]
MWTEQKRFEILRVTSPYQPTLGANKAWVRVFLKATINVQNATNQYNAGPCLSGAHLWSVTCVLQINQCSGFYIVAFDSLRNRSPFLKLGDEMFLEEMLG